MKWGNVRRIKTSVIPILAIGLLVGSAVGITAQEEAADPAPGTWVTSTVAYDNSCWEGPATATDDGAVQQTRGLRCEPLVWESSDPRHTAILATSWTGSERSIEGLILAGQLPPVPDPIE